VADHRVSGGVVVAAWGQGVTAMTTAADGQPEGFADDDALSFEELARRQGVRPITSPDDLVRPEVWESDEEYEDFLTDLYASRRAGLA